MATNIVRPMSLWSLAERQHGIVTRGQLLAAGMTTSAIRHRLARGRLHRIRPGVYAVGRRLITRDGEWMAALLSCGSSAALSHGTAIIGLDLGSGRRDLIELTVPPAVRRTGDRLMVHRRRLHTDEVVHRRGLAITGVTRTLIDVAPTLGSDRLERAINQADKLDLTDPETLRADLERYAGWPGVRELRAILDRHTFVLTDSTLERRFMAIVRRLGLPLPEKRRVNGFTVDFVWHELGLVVETDGLRYHRTPSTQARDLRRDQTHRAAGLVPVRFSHSQVRFEPAWVEQCLSQTIEHLLA